ncbi:unnamed protein product [Moneuplotes crassus]|uniref:RING-type domain-containing protein n=1 Tax=Euplotes crassus TaxID=5936 RepID=A0AAD1XEF7_EUPCR|nr:unnamed protein product [Moneuplotes crassus]
MLNQTICPIEEEKEQSDSDSEQELDEEEIALLKPDQSRKDMNISAGIKFDHLCPICLEIFVNPLVLECKHIVCKLCIENYKKYSRQYKCPMCRKVFLHLIRAKPAVQLLKEIKKAYPKQYEERKKAIDKLIKKYKPKIPITNFKVVCGNTCKLAYPSQCINENQALPVYSYNLYVDFPGLTKDEISFLVSKVEFKLLSKYRNPVRVRSKHPFKISEKGKLRYFARIRIYWNPEFQVKETKLKYKVRFDKKERGNSEEFIKKVKFSKKFREEELYQKIQSLTKKQRKTPAQEATVWR